MQQRIDILRDQSQVFWPFFYETNSLFIHIPKSAGTSISHSLYGQNVGHRKASEYKKISSAEFSKLYSFSFTRNPWERIASAYFFVKRGGNNMVQPTYNEIYQSEKFNTFESFVCNWLNEVDLNKQDVIFEPQHKYVCDNNGIIVDFVGKLENIASDIKVIEENLNRTIVLKNLNSNPNKMKYKSLFNGKTKKIIDTLYEKDIEIFKYSYK